MYFTTPHPKIVPNTYCIATTLRASGQTVRGRNFSTDKHCSVAQRGFERPVPIGTLIQGRYLGSKGRAGPSNNLKFRY